MSEKQLNNEGKGFTSSEVNKELPDVKIEDLGELIRNKRRMEGLTLQEAAEQSTVSAATLSRLERQHQISGNGEINKTPKSDIRVLEHIALWLGVSIRQTFGVDANNQVDDSTREEKTTPEMVEVYLRADRNLDPNSAQALAMVFRAAYEQFRGKGNDKD